MNIYLISQSINNGYDTYDSAIVYAWTEKEARNMHPSGRDSDFDESYPTWVNRGQIPYIDVKLIGFAPYELEKGVVLASFNAG